MRVKQRIGFLEADDLIVLQHAVIDAVALMIATIPVGLRILPKVALAIATKLIIRRHALVLKTRAFEAVANLDVLLTPKTGMLTDNQMEVCEVYVNGAIQKADRLEPRLNRDPVLLRTFRIARFCNNNSSATEGAMLRWVERAGFEAVGDIPSRGIEHEFDQSLKRMTTVHRATHDGMYHIFTKGAPEAVLPSCRRIHEYGYDVPLDEARQHVVERAIHELVGRGLRVIALADRMVPNAEKLARSEAESELTLVALVGIMDPPRTDVAHAVAKLSGAGIRTVMVTGDNPITAYQIARVVGIIEQETPIDQAVITGDELPELAEPGPGVFQRLRAARVFARITPWQLAQIVRAFRQDQCVVGVVGEIAEVVAVQESDVGFAMGNGTDVAREASDVILMDSRFGTIPNAVEEGRHVLHRIRLYLSYILSGNGCEVGAFIVAYAIGIPIPLTALVLLVINFATDSFPALAFAFEPGEKEVMQQTPRKRGTPLINRVMWTHIAVQTLAATVVIMAVYYYVLYTLGYFNLNPATDAAKSHLAVARAAAFMTYIFQKLYRAFTARSMTHNLWEIGVFRNPWTPGAVAISLAIAVFFVYVPVVNSAMGLAPLGLNFILIALAAGLLPPVVEEVTKVVLRARPTTVPAGS